MTTPETPEDEREEERAWYRNPVIIMSFDYTALLILIVLIALLVWWWRS